MFYYIWEVIDKRLKQKRALKLPRPRLGKLDKIIRVISAETDRLAELTHQNITKIYLSDEIDISIDGDEYSFPYFLMDYLEGVEDIDKYIIDNLEALSSDDIISYFRDIAIGLDFLHSKEIIHCDIKPGNIIIAPDSPALIADLGYAKHYVRLDQNDHKETTVTYTPAFAHPSLVEQMKRSTDSAANIAVIQYNELSTSFDLFSLGRTIQKVLQLIREKEKSSNEKKPIFSPYQWNYLAIIAVRLLDGQVTSFKKDVLFSDSIPGLPHTLMPKLAYSSADEAAEDFEKLLNLYDLEGEIPEINPNLSTYIQLPGSRAPLTKRVAKIINHPLFLRLAQVTQLGFVTLIYPGASHTRFEHSLGTFQKCCEIIRSLWYDEVNCLFRSIMTKSDIEATIIASLLHDIGQYPMAHDLAEAHKIFAHDKFTESVLETLDFYMGESIADIIRAEWNTDAESVTSILYANEDSEFKQRLLNSIISGPLDADKLDYLQRDSLHAGVTFGRDIDYGRLLRNLTICFGTDSQGDLVAELGIVEKAKAVAGSIWRARREMFRQVYWHHTVRSLKAMLTYVVRRIIINLTNDDEKIKFNGSLYRFCLSPSSYCQMLRRNDDYNLQQNETISRSVEDSFNLGDSPDMIFSHLSTSDDALISFLWEYADGIGKNILQMIRRRQLFKRVAVLSHAIEKDAFNSVYDRFRHWRLFGYIEEQEERRKRLENVITAKCQEHFRKPLPEGSRAESFPIILVDVPLKALREPAGQEALWYVPEAGSGVRQDSLFETHPVAKSEIQIERTTFDKEVGKIRVLAHPDWYDFITHLSKKDIIKLLQESLS